jgi:hypothetical protein
MIKSASLVGATAGLTSHAVTRKNLLTARAGWSQRDELFEYDHDPAHRIYDETGKRAHNVGAYTIGYTRELGSAGALQAAAGFNVMAYSLASTLKPYYGPTPFGANVFLRFRLRFWRMRCAKPHPAAQPPGRRLYHF